MNVSFKWIGGATWVLQFDTVKIACDPVLCTEGHVQDYRYFKTKRVNSPMFLDSDFKKVNLWLLTHAHEDHIDRYGKQVIHEDSTIVSHKSLRAIFKNKADADIRFLDWHEETEISVAGYAVKVKAVPALHAKRKIFGGMVGNGNGYLVEISGNESKYRIYVTGDSVYDKSMLRHVGNSRVDLIIANAGSAMVGKSFLSKIIGRITNNIDDLREMCSEMKPGNLIPVHWGTFTHYSEIIDPGSFNDIGAVKIVKVGETITVQ